ncbi:MAG: ATP-binding cassette domain-containing protein, partial [Alphaproteobacteria bacterium]|nr:ATP-binding cassette domain-containing protein [Alphaproteobacteria bacterium]
HRAHIQSFVDRFRYKATKARQAQSRIKALERMDIVDAVIADRSVKFSFPQPEKLSAPLISIQNVDVGYTEGKPIIRKIYESIDMNDRIALLGANGNGKSTMIKLIAGKLGAMKGDIVRSGKLRIGYFSQHQTEELDIESTPYQEMMRMVAKKTGSFRESSVRGKLGQFGFSKMLADNRIGDLSGGEKARLLFAFMSYDSPHILLLDEPTNHLDIDAREALVQALNAYEGAVVLVSHDPSMVERVADRLWLVNDGACTLFDGDLEDYREFTIKSRRENRREGKGKKASFKNKKSVSISSLKKKATEAEKEVLRLTAEKDRMDDLMADAELYNNPSKIKQAQKAYSLVLK